MAAELSLWVAREILDHINRKESWTPSYTNMYLGLATASAALRNNLLTNEVASSIGYARIQVGVGTSHTWGLADTSGESYMAGDINFAQATGDWGIVTHCFTSDSATIGAGNVYHIIDLATSKDIVTGDYARFLANEIWVGL